MFGFLFATLCIIGLIFVIARPRRFGHHRYACGHHRGAHFRGRPVGHLLEYLDTTPGQEKVIRRAIGDLVDKGSAEARAMRQSRDELATLVSGDHFDTDRARSWFGTQQERLAHLGDDGVAALAQIHEVLDDRQRRRLGRFITMGPWGHRFGH